MVEAPRLRLLAGAFEREAICAHLPVVLIRARRMVSSWAARRNEVSTDGVELASRRNEVLGAKLCNVRSSQSAARHGGRELRWP